MGVFPPFCYTHILGRHIVLRLRAVSPRFFPRGFYSASPSNIFGATPLFTRKKIAPQSWGPKVLTPRLLRKYLSVVPWPRPFLARVTPPEKGSFKKSPLPMGFSPNFRESLPLLERLSSL